MTIADVLGRTFEFAKERLDQRGINFEAIELRPGFRMPRKHWDVAMYVDVAEHVPEPSDEATTLVRAHGPGGGAAIVASFDVKGPAYPHDLESGDLRFGGHRWRLFLHDLGLRRVGNHLCRHGLLPDRLLRRARDLACRARGAHINVWQPAR